MKLKTLDSLDLKGKTILYRAPYDIEPKKDKVSLEDFDDMRLRATLPTLQYLLEKNCKIVILTYVGRPDGKVVERLRTKPQAERLSKLLNHSILKLDDCVGSEVENKISQMKSGEIIMLENVRFHNEEMIDDDQFAKDLCKGKEIIVFDGFPQAHRRHASTTGIERHLPAVAGIYLQREVETFSILLENPKHPFVIVIGGAKISDKVDAIFNLIKIADIVLIGGAVANVFLKAAGKTSFNSFVEDVFVDKVKREKKDWVEDAKNILEKATSLDKKIILPTDLVVSNGDAVKVIEIDRGELEEGWMAFDIGPKTREEFSKIINQSKTIFLNGPMGKFEDGKFAEGTRTLFTSIKDARINNQAETMVAGGDTINAAREYGDLEDYSHVSLAGGATLEFLAGKVLPALVPLMENF